MSKRLHQDVIINPVMDIWIAGKEITAKMKQNIEEIEVEETDDLKSGIAKVKVNDIDNFWSDADIIVKGASLSITLGHRGDIRRVFDGKISGVEAEYPDSGVPTLIVSGIAGDFDPLRGRMSYTATNQTLTFMINNWFRWLRADSEVDNTYTVLPHIPVNNENVIEFCQRKAKEMGWNFFRTPSGKYYFGKKSLKDFPLETLGYKVGNKAIKSFNPVFSELEVMDAEDDDTDTGSDWDDGGDDGGDY
ncbi:hypothetical protein F400_gp086 [Bacillus phage BCD7]|uniref:Uncharacterized protein n=1 Tax=Bacillus phage BCD7 TaxID=1136534 RepID=J9PTZ4_9CAUD|nr:hypothetical protein F400_gp086 [Bacillus phage BCD7]AEZ50533.1 hypothetical protein BCD7_0086 [Bacillus phage BCD7]